jgi:two-component system, chemotaxis family, chemotaxis protein CheY
MSPATKISHDGRSIVRILVADADDETRSRYRASLSGAGCDVVDAADGRDALVKALSHRPTLVVTETSLPNFDGYALCEVLRRDSMTRTVPILVVTAETRATELDRARAAGADAVLVKPVSPDAVLSEIQRLLGRAAEPAAISAVLGRVTDDSPHPFRLWRAQRRTAQSTTRLRGETTTPPVPPPDLLCPSCDRPLTYTHSHVGGVSSRDSEQWDNYRCPAACGTFEYRQRTRTLRRVR